MGFLGVSEAIVGSLLCCGVGIVDCLFNPLYYVIFDRTIRNHKKLPFKLKLLSQLQETLLEIIIWDT